MLYKINKLAVILGGLSLLGLSSTIRAEVHWVPRAFVDKNMHDNPELMVKGVKELAFFGRRYGKVASKSLRYFVEGQGNLIHLHPVWLASFPSVQLALNQMHDQAKREIIKHGNAMKEGEQKSLTFTHRKLIDPDSSRESDLHYSSRRSTPLIKYSAIISKNEKGILLQSLNAVVNWFDYYDWHPERGYFTYVKILSGPFFGIYRVDRLHSKEYRELCRENPEECKDYEAINYHEAFYRLEKKGYAHNYCMMSTWETRLDQPKYLTAQEKLELSYPWGNILQSEWTEVEDMPLSSEDCNWDGVDKMVKQGVIHRPLAR